MSLGLEAAGAAVTTRCSAALTASKVATWADRVAFLCVDGTVCRVLREGGGKAAKDWQRWALPNGSSFTKLAASEEGVELVGSDG